MRIYTKILTLFILNVSIAQSEVTIVSASSQAADGLDLKAVSEIFKETQNLEEFEQSLNDPDLGINNLDLDRNGQVDFIRVLEEVVSGTHVIILQAVIGVNEFQDVATIEVENKAEKYNMQIHGHVDIYGPNYFIVPSHVHIQAWPIISWIYRPVYRPFRSVYYFGHYPRWWKSFRPVQLNVYRTRTHGFTSRNTFVVSKTRRVKPVTRLVYKPRSSTKFTRNINVGKTTKKISVKKTTTKANGTKVTKKKGIKKTTNRKTGKTTVKKGKKKTKVNKKGKKTTVTKTRKTTQKKKR
jgi:hypothetical protein